MTRPTLGPACSILLVAGLLLGGRPAWAQTVDYGALEEIFGQPITTSATGKPQKISEVPAAMEIVTAEDIRRSGADNIPDALQFLTGVNFRRSSFNDAELSVRGYDQPWNPRLLVLVNGQAVYEDFFGDVVWPAIPVQLDEIRQIEVVKGPNAALFGFNAASGVINIITYDPLYDSVNAATIRSGTQSLREGAMVVSAGLPDRYGIRLSTGGFEADEFKLGNASPDNRGHLLRPEDGTANFDARARLSDDVILAMNGDVGAMQRNFPADIQFESDRTASLRGRLTANTGLGLADIDASLTSWSFNYPILQQAASMSRDVKVSDLFKLGADHAIRLSGEYKYNEADGEFFGGSQEHYGIYSGGAMWDWAISDGVSLTSAVREDDLNLGMKGGLLPATGLTPAAYDKRVLTATSFNEALVARLGDRDTVRLLAGRGYQLPSLNILGMQIGQADGGVLEGNPAIEATAVTNEEIDYDRKLVGLDATLRTALFHQSNDHLFAFLIGVPNGAPNSLESANIGSSDETGLEISLKSRPASGWRWSLGYSYATIADHIGSSSATVLSEPFSVFKDATPRHTVNAGLGYSAGKWDVDLMGGWRSASQDWQFSLADYLYHPMPTRPYTTIDLHGGYALAPHLSLGLTIDQLTQAYTYERGAGAPVERRIFGSLTVRY